MKICPECGDDRIAERLSKGRMVQDYCEVCDWGGPSHIPEQREIKTTKKVAISQFYGWSYEMYDKYGQPITFSRTFDTEEECKEVLIGWLNHYRDKEAGPCTGLIFPAFVEVEAKFYK